MIDDDREIGALVKSILEEEGYAVSTLHEISDEAIRSAVDRLEPACILLDGAQARDYAQAWVTAAVLRQRSRPIPTVMFTAHRREAAEALAATSDRAARAGFTAVLGKPFTIDELVAAVELARGANVRGRHTA